MRYFANRLGGLGQYYLGVLRELAVLDGDIRSGIRYSRQVGQVIAERMDAGVDRDLFMKIVDADMVSAAELDALSGDREDRRSWRGIGVQLGKELTMENAIEAGLLEQGYRRRDPSLYHKSPLP